MFIVTTKTDIETYLKDRRPDVDALDLEYLVESLRDEDHPPWGSNWEDWLEENIEPTLQAIIGDQP